MSAAAATVATTSSTTRTAVASTVASKPTISVSRKVSAAKNKPGIGVELLTAGSAACVADLFTFPLDTAKVRLQVSLGMKVFPMQVTPSVDINSMYLVSIPVKPPSKRRKFIYRDKFSRLAIPIQIQGETGATLKYSGVYGTVSGIARNEGAR